MAVDIKIGDIVQLKSGGPRMTVTSVGFNTPLHNRLNQSNDSGANGVQAIWFAGSKKVNGSFPYDSLIVVPK